MADGGGAAKGVYVAVTIGATTNYRTIWLQFKILSLRCLHLLLLLEVMCWRRGPQIVGHGRRGSLWRCRGRQANVAEFCVKLLLVLQINGAAAIGAIGVIWHVAGFDRYGRCYYGLLLLVRLCLDRFRQTFEWCRDSILIRRRRRRPLNVDGVQ